MEFPAGRGRVFEVTLDPSGRVFSAGPGESVLDAALRQGVPLPYGCRNGACGACRARVLAGEVRLASGDGGGGGDAAASAAPPRGLTAREAAAGWTLLCRARVGSDVRLAARADDAAPAVRTLPARIASKRLLAHDVMELRLRLPPSERLQYRAGQYVHLLLPDGRRRAFSLANCPACDELLELHVRRVPDGFLSGRLFDGPSDGPSGGLAEGALVRIEGPLGGFHLRADADAGGGRPALFLAGGTGFAPVKSIIENALLEGPLEREMHLYRGVRALRDLYLPELPREWAQGHPPLRYVPVLSEPAPEDGWSGRTGLVHEAVLADFPDLSGCEVYASGPPPMVRAVRERFPERGLDPERLFFDSFDHAYETGHDG